MKAKIIYYCVPILFLVVAFGFSFYSQPSSSINQDFNSLTLKIQSDKEDYILGELVTLKFQIINGSDALIFLNRDTDVWHGHLKVFIAYEDQKYREYVGPGWGIKDNIGMGSIKLTPGTSFKTEATILYNHRLETAHLSEMYAKQIGEERVESEYAFSEPGQYRIKAILYDSGFANKIEPDPIQININEPQGIDLEVWNELKDDAEYGYFIQTGGPKGDLTSIRTQVIVETLDRIANFYTMSRYAESIRSSLSKHYSSLEELKKKGLVPPALDLLGVRL